MRRPLRTEDGLGLAVSYRVELTGPQLRVLHTVLSVVLNDPDWTGDGEHEGMIGPPRDTQTLERAHEALLAALRIARRTESTRGASL